MRPTFTIGLALAARADKLHRRYLSAVERKGLTSDEACGWWDQWERCAKAVCWLADRGRKMLAVEEREAV